jgi:hypothetical protein
MYKRLTQHVINPTDNTLLSVIFSTIASFQKQGVSLTDYITTFQKSAGSYAAAQAIRAIVTRGQRSIHFRTLNGTTVALQTFPYIYEAGTSIVHLDYEKYWQSPDFLMIPAVRNLTGLSFEGIVARNALGGLPYNGAYGPLTRMILHTIGWPLPESPSDIKLIIAQDINVINILSSNPSRELHLKQGHHFTSRCLYYCWYHTCKIYIKQTCYGYLLLGLRFKTAIVLLLVYTVL